MILVQLILFIKLISYLKVMFQVARKFRVLQVGGHDLGSLFNQKVMSNGIILMLVCLILKVAIKML